MCAGGVGNLCFIRDVTLEDTHRWTFFTFIHGQRVSKLCVCSQSSKEDAVVVDDAIFDSSFGNGSAGGSNTGLPKQEPEQAR